MSDPTEISALLAARGLDEATIQRALTEHLEGPRAQDMAAFTAPDELRRELLEEARQLAEGGPALWSDFIVRYLDTPVDGVLAAVIRHAGADAVEPLLAVVRNEAERDPDSESSGYAPIHAAHLLAELGDTRIVEPLLDLLPTLEPGEPLVDAVEAALHGFGDALMAPTLVHIEAAEDDETRLALWMALARSEIDDDRIRDGLVTLLAAFPEEAAHGLSLYGDAAILPAVFAAFDALPDENPVRVVDMAESIKQLGGELSPEQAARAAQAEQTAVAMLEAQYEADQVAEQGAEKAAPPPPRRQLSGAQKTAARQKKKVQRQMKKKSRPKKKK